MKSIISKVQFIFILLSIFFIGNSLITFKELDHYFSRQEFDNLSLTLIIICFITNVFITIIFSFITLKNLLIVETLKKQAIIDPLTKLYNRRYLDQISNSISKDIPLSVITLDIDHFKNINDTYGHPFGDRVLRKLTSILQYNFRESDCGIRMGGEEFMIILPKTDVKSAYTLAERIRKLVESQKISFREGVKVQITISLGVTCLRDNDTFDSFIERADSALYMAKNFGRNVTVTTD